MFIIFGLGNPGKKYKKTRHNVGAMAVDKLRSSSHFADARAVEALPETFMNFSGRTAKKLLKNRNLKARNLVVIHDDMDLPLGQIRIAKNRGSAGHKGVESIIKELGTKNFIRFRIGIKPEAESAGRRTKNPEKFVLQNFSKKEAETAKRVIKKTAEAIEVFLKKGLEKAMNEFNK